MIKKDQDLNKLSFVSFKIDVVDEHFDELMDAANWSSRHLIREFVRMKLPEKTQPVIDLSNSLSPSQQRAFKRPHNADDLLQFNTPQGIKMDVDNDNANDNENFRK